MEMMRMTHKIGKKVKFKVCSSPQFLTWSLSKRLLGGLNLILKTRNLQYT